MKSNRKVKQLRGGAVVPLTAILLIPLMMMVGFAVDIGHIVHTKSALQNAADAAALAGVQSLMDGWVQYHMPVNAGNSGNILTLYEDNAKASAKSIASANGAANISSLTLLDADIVFGTTAADHTFTPNTSGYPNAVQITIRMDATNAVNGGSVPLYFVPAMGIKSQDLTATAVATLTSGNITGFKPGAGLLPATFDDTIWNSWLLGTGHPGIVSRNDTDNSRSDIRIYPSSNLAPGNFGMLSLNDNFNSASAISNWEKNGLSQSDIDALYSTQTIGVQHDVLLPLQQFGQTGATHDMSKFSDWKGVPGFKASDLKDLPQNVALILPVFKPIVNIGTTTTVSTLTTTSNMTAGSPYTQGGNSYTDYTTTTQTTTNSTTTTTDWNYSGTQTTNSAASSSTSSPTTNTQSYRTGTGPTLGASTATGSASTANNNNIYQSQTKDPSDNSVHPGPPGDGENAYYNLIDFVGIIIRNDASGDNQIWVQPAVISNPYVKFGTVSVATPPTSGQLPSTFMPAPILTK